MPAGQSTATPSQATPTREASKRPRSPSPATTEPRKRPKMSATAILEKAMKDIKAWEESQQSSLPWVAIAEKIIDDGKKQQIECSEEYVNVQNILRVYRYAVEQMFNELEEMLHDLHHDKPWTAWRNVRQVVADLIDANGDDVEGVEAVRAKLEEAEGEIYGSGEE
ncbi:hypothetical protein HFD88_005778 [Aspergillus terreus]|nr:hypothetical protein HFD88_005778 [Aspergillus terreus]